MKEISIVHCEDTEEIRAMDKVCFGAKYAMSTRQLNESRWWVAIVGGKPAAFGGAKVMKNGTTCYLTRAGTLPAFRGLGLQDDLIERRKKYGRDLELSYAITYTSIYNCASVNNLINAGFRMYRPQRAWEGRGFLYWRCAL